MLQRVGILGQIPTTFNNVLIGTVNIFIFHVEKYYFVNNIMAIDNIFCSTNKVQMNFVDYRDVKTYQRKTDASLHYYKSSIDVKRLKNIFENNHNQLNE